MFPNFLIAGVAKAGTTSLYYYLQEHPEIVIPKKETFFFINEFYNAIPNDWRGQRDLKRIIKNENTYRELYKGCTAPLVGEVSTCYVYFYDKAIPLIKKWLDDPVIIIVLRNPAERAWSAYQYHVSLRLEELNFEEALKAEKARIANHWDFMWHYTSLGFYYEGVKAFKSNFSNVKIVLYDDLKNNSIAFMNDLFNFMGAAKNFSIDTSVKYNISDEQENNFWFRYLIQNKPLKRILKPIVNIFLSDSNRMKIVHSFRKENNNKKEMPDNIKEQLRSLYKQDILNLQNLLAIDLNKWLTD